MDWRRWLFDKGLTPRPPARIPIPGRTLNSALSAEAGVDVVMIETVPVRAGDVVDVEIERARTDWPQGIWFGTEGLLEVAGTRAPQLTIWTQTAPPAFAIDVVHTAGALHFYNVWDSGRGIKPRESQGASSGMVLLDESDGRRRYGCSDIGLPPDFQKLVFRLRVR